MANDEKRKGCEVCKVFLPETEKWEAAFPNVTIDNPHNHMSFAEVLTIINVCNACKERDTGDNGFCVNPADHALEVAGSIWDIHIPNVIHPPR